MKIDKKVEILLVIRTDNMKAYQGHDGKWCELETGLFKAYGKINSAKCAVSTFQNPPNKVIPVSIFRVEGDSLVEVWKYGFKVTEQFPSGRCACESVWEKVEN